MGFEKVSLFGLTIVPRRRVRFGRINPEVSRELLIRNGLIEGELDCSAEFFVHNHKLMAELEELRVKSRRADFLKGEDALIEFYEQRLPADVVDLASLLKWCKTLDCGDQSRRFSNRNVSTENVSTENASSEKTPVLKSDDSGRRTPKS